MSYIMLYESFLFVMKLIYKKFVQAISCQFPRIPIPIRNAFRKSSILDSKFPITIFIKRGENNVSMSDYTLIRDTKMSHENDIYKITSLQVMKQLYLHGHVVHYAVSWAIFCPLFITKQNKLHD